jgi:acyl-CoA synthetase (AMP-forming)/AMP-acid ligase II
MILATSEQIARYTADGWWGSETLFDIFTEQRARRGAAMAIVDPANRSEITGEEPARLTWDEVGEKAERLASRLAEWGFRKDDFVGVQLPTTHEAFVTYLACWRIGAIPTPVPFQYREHELEYILNHVKARGFITCARIGSFAHAELALRVAANAPSLKRVMAFGAPLPNGVVTLDEALRAPADTALLERIAAEQTYTANDLALVIWTSGTEATPKAVPRSHNNVRMARRLMADAADLADGASILAPRLLNTTGGLTGALMPWLAVGAKLVLHQPFSLEVFVQQIHDEGVEFASAPPAILHDLLKRDDLLGKINFARLRHLSSGSAALSEWMVQAYRDRYGVEILNFYGSSEGGSLGATPKDLPEPELRAHFFPRYGDPRFQWASPVAAAVETKLIDDGGRIIAEAGVPGELCFRGPNVSPGYYNAPELTAAAFDADGFLHSGDLFEIGGDRDQFYRFIGRAKDIIVRGGMNISATELEGLLIEHPGVMEVAVIGYPDEKLGEKTCAVAVVRPGTTLELDDLVRFLRDERHVAVYKLPQRLILVDKLPRTPAGKVMKNRLRELTSPQPAG